MRDAIKPAKPNNGLTEGTQTGLVADLPQNWLSTVCILLASRLPLLVNWGLALLKFHHIFIPSDRLRNGSQFKPDIIFFINLMMRVSNRFSATQQMRLLPQFKDVTILALSASGFDFEQQQSRHAGAHGFLSKSVGETDLLKKLRGHLKLEWVKQERESSSFVSSLDSGFNKQHSSIALPAQKVSLVIVAAATGIVEGTERREAMEHQQRLPAAICFRQSKSFKSPQILEFVY